MHFPTLETSRLIIRPLVTGDMGACHELYQAIGFTDQESSEDETRRQCCSWLNWTVQSYHELARLKQPPYGDRAKYLSNKPAPEPMPAPLQMLLSLVM